MNKSTQQVLFSSKTSKWSTPQDFYNKLHAIYNFTLDPCASDENHKCEKYFTEKDDGLSQSWEGERVFMNPPYGRNVKTWIRKAYEESMKPDTIVVCLLASRTDTRWFYDYCMKAEKISFVKGRLKFGGNKNPAPFPSCVVVFRNSPTTNPKVDAMLP